LEGKKKNGPVVFLAEIDGLTPADAFEPCGRWGPTKFSTEKKKGGTGVVERLGRKRRKTRGVCLPKIAKEEKNGFERGRFGNRQKEKESANQSQKIADFNRERKFFPR